MSMYVITGIAASLLVDFGKNGYIVYRHTIAGGLDEAGIISMRP